MSRNSTPSDHPHVVIVGAGFGGLVAALYLRHVSVRLTVIDRSNHHLFQPLLYQVATAALSPAQMLSDSACLGLDAAVHGMDGRCDGTGYRTPYRSTERW